MLTIADLAMIRAALRYWDEEIVPHGIEAARPYFDGSGVEPLTAAEVAALRSELQEMSLLYVVYDGETLGVDQQMFRDADAALQKAGPSDFVATVLRREAA